MKTICLVLLLAASTACGDDSSTTVDGPPGGGPDGPPAAGADAGPECADPVAGAPDLVREEVASGLDSPIYVTSPPGDPRLFVVEKGGVIKIIDGGQALDPPFLDIDAIVQNPSDLSDERGLLGLAFSPDYATSGRFYVFYTDDASNDQHVAEYTVSADPNVADDSSATVVLMLEDFAGNHNGGMIEFGPDGFLYISHGDGGGGGDELEVGQTTDELYANILRIDVATLPYTIPASNPFVADGGEPEIWSYGLRNAWRFSFDRATGDMYIADVGQGQWEEVNVEPADAPGGLNYGWDDMEGTHCYEPSAGCNMTGKTMPVYEYSHGEGCSISGGYVYRGCKMPGYHGTYFFGDYCGNFVRSFEWDGAGGVTNVTSWDNLGTSEIVSFGEDRNGELYIVQQSPGTIWKIVPAQ